MFPYSNICTLIWYLLIGVKFLPPTCIEGVYVFGGLPNGTEVTQEKDQVFAA